MCYMKTKQKLKSIIDCFMAFKIPKYTHVVGVHTLFQLQAKYSGDHKFYVLHQTETQSKEN